MSGQETGVYACLLSGFCTLSFNSLRVRVRLALSSTSLVSPDTTPWLLVVYS